MKMYYYYFLDEIYHWGWFCLLMCWSETLVSKTYSTCYSIVHMITVSSFIKCVPMSLFHLLLKQNNLSIKCQLFGDKGEERRVFVYYLHTFTKYSLTKAKISIILKWEFYALHYFIKYSPSGIQWRLLSCTSLMCSLGLQMITFIMFQFRQQQPKAFPQMTFFKCINSVSPVRRQLNHCLWKCWPGLFLFKPHKDALVSSSASTLPI